MNQVFPAAMILAMTLLATGCAPQAPPPPPVADVVRMGSDRMPDLYAKISGEIDGATPPADWTGGLVGAMGGARVKLLRDGDHELLLVLPQLTAAQIPVCYAITTIPPEAATEFLVGRRQGTHTNEVLRIRLNGTRGQEVRINWSALLLLAQPATKPVPDVPFAYLQEAGCAQSSAEGVTTLADELWPENGTTRAFAIALQDHIRNMKQQTQPRSMDAVGILESGANWICTANANLAMALFRARGIPARSLAVIPPTGRRLEMHRIVEYFDEEEWLRFDPSSIDTNVPMESWQTIVMAITTPEDEALAMTPRMGASRGVPYGQELEFITGRMTFSGPDFFWTLARPLAGFEADVEVSTLARQAWSQFLETGNLSDGQRHAVTATNATGLQAALGGTL